MKIVHSDTTIDEEEENEMDNMCLICHNSFNLTNGQKLSDIKESNNEICVLECGHKFHYDCIINSYKINKFKRKCPYCRSESGYIKLIPGIVPKLGIHKEYQEYMNCNRDLNDINFIKGRCQYILKRGINSGKQCSYKLKCGNYCVRHNKLFNTEQIDNLDFNQSMDITQNPVTQD